MEQQTTLPSTTVTAPPTRSQSVITTTAFVLEHNLRRLVILAVVFALAVFFFTFRGIFEGILGLIQQAPQLLVTLLFYAFAMIVQFGVFMGMDVFMVIPPFRKARSLARKYAAPGTPGVCIIFLDELASIGLSRGGMGGNQAMMGPMGMMGGRSLALNTMLNQMDSLGQ